MLFSARFTFNDPFDSRPGFRIAQETAEGRKYILEGIKNAIKISPSQRLLEAQRFSRTQKNPQHGENEIMENFLDKNGILSLASCWENQLMWAHYAKHHKGICIGFKSDVDFFATALKVKYSSELPIILRPNDDGDTVLEKTFLTKSDCWKYEDEWRVIKKTMSQYEIDTTFHEDENIRRLLKDHNGPNLYKFDCSAIESVTIGMRVSDADTNFVIDSMKKAANGVPLYKAKKSRLKYSLERELIGHY